MPKQYVDFGFVPDFTDPPVRGIIDEKISPILSAAPEFIEWPWPRPARTFSFSYVRDGQTELRAIKRVVDDLGARHRALYLPTWERDFRVAAAATSGSRDVEITKSTAGYVADYLPDDREDTPGRVVYFWIPGQAQAFITRITRVRASVSQPSTQEIISLEDSLPFAVDADSWYGWAMVCRLSVDDVVWNHLDRDIAAARLEFRQLRTYVQTEQTLTLDAGTQPTATTEAITTATLTEADAAGDYDFTHVHASYCEGPATKGVVAHPYRTDWAAWTGSGGIRFHQTAGPIWPPDDATGSLSTLENSGAVTTDHLSFCFDGAADETVAYETTKRGPGEQFQVRHFDSGATTRGPFTGTSPTMVYNGIVMVPPTSHAADSDVVCYYLKSTTNSLYARHDRDDYATEVEVCQLPIKLVRIIRIYRNSVDNSLRMVGIDDGQRRVVLDSAVYA